MCHVCRCICRFCLVCYFMKTFFVVRSKKKKKGSEAEQMIFRVARLEPPSSSSPPRDWSCSSSVNSSTGCLEDTLLTPTPRLFWDPGELCEGFKRDPLTFWKAERCVSCHDSRKFPRLYSRPHSERLHLTHRFVFCLRAQSRRHDRNEHISLDSVNLIKRLWTDRSVMQLQKIDKQEMFLWGKASERWEDKICFQSFSSLSVDLRIHLDAFGHVTLTVPFAPRSDRCPTLRLGPVFN